MPQSPNQRNGHSTNTLPRPLSCINRSYLVILRPSPITSTSTTFDTSSRLAGSSWGLYPFGDQRLPQRWPQGATSWDTAMHVGTVSNLSVICVCLCPPCCATTPCLSVGCDSGCYTSRSPCVLPVTLTN